MKTLRPYPLALRVVAFAAVVIWAMEDWDTWAAIEVAYEEDDEVARWRDRTSRVVVDWRSKLLAPAPLCPLNTGTIL